MEDTYINLNKFKLPRVLNIKWPTCELECIVICLLNNKKDYEFIFNNCVDFEYRLFDFVNFKNDNIIEFKELSKIIDENLLLYYGLQRTITYNINNVYDLLKNKEICITAVNPNYYKFDHDYLQNNSIENTKLKYYDAHYIILQGYNSKELFIVDPYYEIECKLSYEELKKCYMYHFEFEYKKKVNYEEAIYNTIYNINNIVRNESKFLLASDIVNRWDFLNDKEVFEKLRIIFYEFSFRQELYCLLLKYIMYKSDMEINCIVSILSDFYSLSKKWLKLGAKMHLFYSDAESWNKEASIKISNLINTLAHIERRALEKIRYKR